MPLAGSASVGIARQDIDRIDVRTGRLSRGATVVRTMGIGALAGTILGVAGGLASGNDRNCSEIRFTAGDKGAFLGLSGLVTGSAVGAVVGAVRPRPDRWTRVIPSFWGPTAD